MDEISFVANPDLIAIATMAVPIIVEILTRVDASSKVKQHVATAVVVLVLIGSACIDYFVDHTFRLDSVSDVTSLGVLMFAQFGLVRASVEGGHRLMDAVEPRERPLAAVLFPNFGVGAGTKERDQPVAA